MKRDFTVRRVAEENAEKQLSGSVRMVVTVAVPVIAFAVDPLLGGSLAFGELPCSGGDLLG